ncbi:MAG TPA: division/cell wall cluster transcriptional repressor MraZ [Patescibacteria group bacterium]|nr:division/cell wall cluster transcriptional repressor MraZ [Patescibacteria group bacterium]
MFIGEYSYTIDDKGRIATPPKYRGELHEGVVVTRGLDDCLFMYGKKEWDVIAEKLGNMPTTDKSARDYARLMLAGAMDIVPDKTGRIVLPQYLRDFAHLKKDIVVAGLYNRIEIWDESAWKKYEANIEKNSSDIADKLSSLGV